MRKVCLVGPGDSAKTTVLDAIEIALSPARYVAFSDIDFYDATITEPIVIEVTVGEIPVELQRYDKFGDVMRGWHPKRGLVDDPDDDCELVLAIRVEVTADLEPSWTVIKESRPEGKRIGYQDRARLGVVRLGHEVERDLAWGRLSMLSRLTDDLSNVNAALTEATRKARDVVRETNLQRLKEAAKKAQNLAKQLGVSCREEYVPALDSKSVFVRTGALSLHDGQVPVRAAGLGSRRLVAFGIQQEAVADGAIVLIDEIEHGLEPHRVRRLLRRLSQDLTRINDEGHSQATPRGQVIMTTHSPVVVQRLSEGLCVVRSAEGEITIKQVSPDLSTTREIAPEAFVGRKILVCEGKTEVGLCRGLKKHWENEHGGVPIECEGVVLVYGQGNQNAPARAIHFAQLGYDVAYFGDSDTPPVPDESKMREKGIKVLLWADTISTDQRIFSDLPPESIKKILDILVTELGQQRIHDSVMNHATASLRPLPRDIQSWPVQQPDMRMTLGTAAKNNGWLKSLEISEKVGQIIGPALNAISATDLATKLTELENWCYG